MEVRIGFAIILIINSIRTFSQVPVADFTLPANACINQSLYIENNSTPNELYQWDFCDGDLKQTPIASLLVNGYGGYGTRTEIEEDNGVYVGFFISGGSQNLYRLNFGSSLTNNPTLTNLGNMGLNSNQLRAITIVKEGSLYFGFIIDSQKNTLYRLDFGNSLLNTPQNPIEIYQGNPLNSPFQLTTLTEDYVNYLFVTNNGDGNLVRLKFTSGYSSAIEEAFPIPVSSQWLNSVSFIKEDGIWHAACVSPLLGQILKIDFVNGVDSNVPAITFINATTPISAEFVNENGLYYIIGQSRDPQLSLIRLSFGTSLSNTPVASQIPNVGFGGPEIWNFSLFNSESKWVGFAVEQVGQNIYRVMFPNSCFSDSEVSDAFEPKVVTMNSGIFSVALKVLDTNGNASFVAKAINVSTLESPDIEMVTQNQCVNNPVLFTSINTSGNVISYQWDFGDAGTATSAGASHTYDNANTYELSLIVNSSSGCLNEVHRDLKIYNAPVTSFTLPSGMLCTNNEFSFINTTLDNFDGNLTYNWYVNDIPTANTRDLRHTFTSAGDKLIKLTTAIPGCINELTQTLFNVQIGPEVNFSYVGKCVSEEIYFNNETTEPIVGYQWDFDNGVTSEEVNPIQSFSSYGNYAVSLIGTGTNGCSSTVTKQVSIYSVPQPNFSLDLPPFSCAGTPSQFNDLTPPLPDSNLASWAWSFGDPSNSTAPLQNPTHTYTAAGDYAVSLEVTSNFGCSTSAQKTVTISEPPSVDFFYDPACLSQGTRFTDASSADVKAWLWSIQNSTYTSKNPTHTFNATGEFPVMVTVTGTNNCINQLSKPVQVPIPVAVNFNAVSTCATLPATFTELTAAGTDPAVSWSWDFNGQRGAGSPEQHTFPTVGTYPVTLSSIRASGCTYKVTKLIPIITPPVAQFIASTEAGAAPLAVGFTNLSTNASSFLWAFNDAANTTSSEFSPSFIFNDLGIYPVQLIASNSAGCSDSFVKSIHVVVPEMNAAVTDFELLPAGNGTWRATVTVLNKSNLAISNPEIFVDLSGLTQIKERLPITLQPNQSVTQSLSSNFVVSNLQYACAEVRLAEDFYDFDNQQCANLTTESVAILPYPNPVSDELVVNWINTEYDQLSIAIYNSAGQIMLRQEYNPILPNLNQVKIDVSKLGQGIYYVSLSAGGKMSSYRVAIVR